MGSEYTSGLLVFLFPRTSTGVFPYLQDEHLVEFQGGKNCESVGGSSPEAGLLEPFSPS